MRLPKCRTFWITVALLLIIVGALLFVPGSQITPANCARLEMGMTLEEVQAILGDGGVRRPLA